MAACDDVKIGGTVTGGGITGGRSVSSYDLAIFDYSGLWGAVGKRAAALPIIGQPGRVITGDELPSERLLSLSVVATRYTAAGVKSDAQQLWDNQDDQTALFDPAGGIVIEWVLPTESRWIRAYALTMAPLVIFQELRRMALPLIAPWPYWQSDTEESQVVNGAAVSIAALGGTAERVYNPKLVFSGNGSFTDDTSGLQLTVAGASGAVTVERDPITGRWTATEGGSPVPGKVSENDSRWMFLTRGGTFTSTVSTTVYWRDQYA